MPGRLKWDKRKGQIKSRIASATATESMINEVLYDLELHLATESGTYDNYCGIFGKETLDNLRKNYPHCTNWGAIDGIKEQKCQKVINCILDKFYYNKNINISPIFVKMAIDYIRNEKKDTTTNNIVVVGYPQSDKGKSTQALPKSH